MGVTVMNILAGPVQVIQCTLAAPEPDEDDFVSFNYSAAAYRDCGGSNGGVGMVIAQSFGKVTADQTVDIIASLADERSVTAELSLLETTLENLKMANNGGDIVTGAEGSRFEPVTNTVETPPDYTKLFLRGTSAVSGRKGLLILRRVLVTSDVAFRFEKSNATMLGITLTSHYVSNTVPPFAFFQED